MKPAFSHLCSLWTVFFSSFHCSAIACSEPTPPAHAILLTPSDLNTTHYFGDKVNIICQKGYGFIGQHFGHDIAAMRCESNGKWSSAAYECQSETLDFSFLYFQHSLSVLVHISPILLASWNTQFWSNISSEGKTQTQLLVLYCTGDNNKQKGRNTTVLQF